MRTLLALLLVAALPLFATQQPGDAGGTVARGAEKEAHGVAQPDAAHGGGAEHGPKTYFGIPGWLLKLINMILFIGVLAWFIGGPIKKGLAARKESIRLAAEEARARRQKADGLAADIQARLTQIEEDVRAIHERAVNEGERQKRELIAAAEAEAEKMLQAARNEVDIRLKHARRELTEYAGKLATDRAEAILREKITDADQQKLFRESLSEVEGVRS